MEESPELNLQLKKTAGNDSTARFSAAAIQTANDALEKFILCLTINVEETLERVLVRLYGKREDQNKTT